MKFQRVFVLMLAFLMVPAILQASVLLDRVVAVVNQEVITWSDLYKAMEFEASDKMRELNNEERMKVFKENEAEFLERLIDMKLMLQTARRSGIDATLEEVNEAINDIKKKYSLDEPSLMESLKKEGFTLDEYKKKLAEQIILSRIVSQQVRNKIVVPQSDIDKEMAKSKEALAEGESYKISQIFFKKPDNEADMKMVEEKAAEMLKLLGSGEDFSSLARKYSEDPSAKSGGALGYVKKQYMAKEFIDVLSQIKKGDITRPFWTDRGLHILKLDEKVEKQSDAEMKEAVRNKLFEKLFEERYKSWIRELRAKALIEVRL